MFLALRGCALECENSKDSRAEDHSTFARRWVLLAGKGVLSLLSLISHPGLSSRNVLKLPRQSMAQVMRKCVHSATQASSIPSTSRMRPLGVGSLSQNEWSLAHYRYMSGPNLPDRIACRQYRHATAAADQRQVIPLARNGSRAQLCD
jgi:hypothetical protein